MHSFAFTLSGKVCVPMKILMHQFLDVMSAVNVISRFLIQTWQTFTLFLVNMQFLYRQDIFYILLSLHKILKCIQGLFGWFILYAIFMHHWWGYSFGHARSGNISFTQYSMCFLHIWYGKSTTHSEPVLIMLVTRDSDVGVSQARRTLLLLPSKTIIL